MSSSADPTDGFSLCLEDGSTIPLPRPPARDFDVGEVVLAFHGQLLYEAKVLSVGPGMPAETYEVHYQGWKMSWDETVPRASVVEHNDMNLRIAHELLRSAKVRQQRQAALMQAEAPPVSDEVERGEGDGDGGGGDEMEEDSNGAPAGGSGTGKDVKEKPSLFLMPDVLKRQAVDDWEYVTKERRLVTIPRDVTVAMVLDRWTEDCSARGTGSGADRAAREVKMSLLEYFDALLPTMLLYTFERPQFEKYFQEGSIGEKNMPQPRDVYGCEHLVRLLVKLPSLLEGAQVEPQVLKAITVKVNNLMQFIKANGRSLFLPVYEPAPEGYLPFDGTDG